MVVLLAETPNPTPSLTRSSLSHSAVLAWRNRRREEKERKEKKREMEEGAGGCCVVTEKQGRDSREEKERVRN